MQNTKTLPPFCYCAPRRLPMTSTVIKCMAASYTPFAEKVSICRRTWHAKTQFAFYKPSTPPLWRGEHPPAIRPAPPSLPALSAKRPRTSSGRTEFKTASLAGHPPTGKCAAVVGSKNRGVAHSAWPDSATMGAGLNPKCMDHGLGMHQASILGRNRETRLSITQCPVKHGALSIGIPGPNIPIDASTLLKRRHTTLFQRQSASTRSVDEPPTRPCPRQSKA